MIFAKKTWSTGDTVDATEMNRIEAGIHEANLRLDQSGNALKIQAGRASVNPTYANNPATNTYEVHVNFPDAFASVPYVIVSAETSGPERVFASAKGTPFISKTGFDLVVYRTGSATTSVSWIAVAPTA